MSKQSSVEWLINELTNLGYIHAPSFGHKIIYDKFEQAKAMQQEQAQQYAEFCVQCDRQSLPLLDFNSWIAHNETFNIKEK